MRWISLSCFLVLLGACSATPQLAQVPPAPIAPPGAAPADAQRQLEAQELEQAEAKCATQKAHAVAQRTASGTLYSCVAPGDSPPPAPAPNP
jgi:hypothetical protein